MFYSFFTDFIKISSILASSFLNDRISCLELIKFNITNNSSLEKIVIYDKQLFLLVKKYTNSKRPSIKVEYKNESKIPFFYSFLYIKNCVRSFCFVIFCF